MTVDGYAMLVEKVKTKIVALDSLSISRLGVHVKVVELDGSAIKARTVASAIWREDRCTIKYNPAVLIEHGDDFIEEIITHEFAHLVATQYYRADVGHGPKWKHIVSVLGGKPISTTMMDPVAATVKHRDLVEAITGKKAAVRQQTRIEYKCGCRSHMVSKTRHNKIVKDNKRYMCRLCQQEIVYA